MWQVAGKESRPKHVKSLTRVCSLLGGDSVIVVVSSLGVHWELHWTVTSLSIIGLLVHHVNFTFSLAN